MYDLDELAKIHVGDVASDLSFVSIDGKVIACFAVDRQGKKAKEYANTLILEGSHVSNYGVIETHEGVVEEF